MKPHGSFQIKATRPDCKFLQAPYNAKMAKLIRRTAAIAWLKDVIETSTPTDCVNWIGQTDRDGYGNVHWLINGESKRYLIHRVMLSMVCPTDPEKPLALHSCHNPTCCNPYHLRWGTQADNVRDREEAGRGKKSRVSRSDVEQLKKVKGHELKALAKQIGISWSWAYAISRGYPGPGSNYTPYD